MPYDSISRLWPNSEDVFFRDRDFPAMHQHGPHCVSTTLAILTGETPERFQDVLNTQDPVSWSKAIRKWGMQLAYCPTDVRKLRFYIPELLKYDDLFTLSYYTHRDGQEELLRDPREDGWVCGSHIVVMHRDKILDPATGTITDATEDHCNDRHTKRIFRVVPAGHHRSL